MKIAVVDDMETERDKLCEICTHWAKTGEVICEMKEFSSGEIFLEALSDDEFDMVFMDIYMSEINGIETAKTLREISTRCLIVFLTTSEEHVWEAFPLHPFDYVVKPYNECRIFNVLDEAAKVIPENESYIEVTAGRRKIVLNFSEIVYVRSENHHMMVTTADGSRVKVYSTFAEISDVLLRDSRFILCNRGIIVNMDFVKKSDELCFKLENDETIALRVKDASRIRDEFANYCFKSTKHWRE